MNVHLLVLTDGRQHCLERTLPSAESQISGPISSRMIIDDSMDASYGSWLRCTWPDYEVVSGSSKLGFGGAIRLGWSLTPMDADYLLHLEDDFTFNQPVSLDQMMAILDSVPHMAQLVLKRQSWNETEKAAGGIVECWPDLYQDVETAEGWYAKHHLFFSTNPCLYRRSIVERGWPDCPRSEAMFTAQLLGQDFFFAFLGRKLDPPRVQHIGEERVGVGY